MSDDNSEILKQIESLKAQLPKKIRKPKKLPVAISEEEFERLLDKTKQKSHKLAFILSFGSGLRISEIVGDKKKGNPPLNKNNFDFKQGLIMLLNAKGGKDRAVPIPKGFRKEMFDLLPLDIGSRALQIAFKRACKRAKLLESKPSLHFHSLRHGFASHAVSKGMPIHHLRTLMGHSNISTTNVYLEANPTEAIKSYMDKF